MERTVVVKMKTERAHTAGLTGSDETGEMRRRGEGVGAAHGGSQNGSLNIAERRCLRGGGGSERTRQRRRTRQSQCRRQLTCDAESDGDVGRTEWFGIQRGVLRGSSRRGYIYGDATHES